MIDRYRQAGLTRNPFAFSSDRPITPVDRGLPAPSYQAGTLVQVVGHKGAGKTTQVQAWRDDVAGPYHYVEPELGSRWTKPPMAPVVYADEVDRMAPPVRYRWFRRLARGRCCLIMGTHVDLSAVAERAGLATTTHVLGPVDRATLDEIVRRRIEAVSLPGHPQFQLRPSQVSAVHAAAGGSIRDAETLLHELVAELVAERHVEQHAARRTVRIR